MTRNPFGPIQNERDAEQAAKAGVITAGWIILDYLVTFWAMALSERPTDNILWDGAVLFASVCTVVLGILAIAVGWIIWSRQPLWASILILAWLVIGYTYQLAHGTVGVAALVMTVIAAGCGILSVRGAFYHQRFVDEQAEREAAGA
jgi:uncharacterized membrane protein